MPEDSQPLSSSALVLINVFDQEEKEKDDDKIVVNHLISKVASFYEKFRTAMDYGSEETIPRRAIERMLKRMLFLEADSKALAQDLLRELVWAGYLPNATVPESIIIDVSTSISLYLKLKNEISRKKFISSQDLNEFIIQTLSCEILHTLIPNKEKNTVANFMFKNLKNSLTIDDDSEQTRDIQVFIAIRKSFAKDDIAFLQFRLFREIFGKLTEENFSEILSGFESGYKEIKHQLSYPKKERILNHIKKKTPPFLILYDILSNEKGNIKNLVKNEKEFREKIFETCDTKYQLIRRTIQTAIVRSVIFILTTKAILALAVEGTFESIFFDGIQWSSIALNTTLPPLIMVLVGLGIRTPGQQNSEIIYKDIRKLLFEEDPSITNHLSISLKSKGKKTLYDYLFSMLWFLSIVLTFGGIWYILSLLNFNVVSKGIFIFFIAIISFLSYRIYQAANSYSVIKKQSLFTPFFDFLFIPIIRVGRGLTEGISQINFILLVIDFLIEAPFKGTIGFFEQWFLFAARKREELE
ncbi:MAG: hypothetical protein ACD_37C00126G0002 [uncultured bacterium]|nr:MAG: hypothetical protein ACD_37C00126G0002 [uncultured bacterium]